MTKEANNKKKKFQADVCEHCRQTTEYALPLDRGTCLIVLALFNAVRSKGVNRIDVMQEMVADPREFPSYREMVSAGKMSYRMEGNISRARRHGLIASADVAGEWLLTKKGAAFLRGEDVPRLAIVDKASSSKKYYLDEESDRVTFSQLMRKETPFWDLDLARLDEIAGAAAAEQPTLGV